MIIFIVLQLAQNPHCDGQKAISGHVIQQHSGNTYQQQRAKKFLSSFHIWFTTFLMKYKYQWHSCEFRRCLLLENVYYPFVYVRCQLHHVCYRFSEFFRHKENKLSSPVFYSTSTLMTFHLSLFLPIADCQADCCWYTLF